MSGWNEKIAVSFDERRGFWLMDCIACGWHDEIVKGYRGPAGPGLEMPGVPQIATAHYKLCVA